jgi:uncharacterized protein YeaO (DUF488 family)
VVTTKRVYEPYSPRDGYRVLVDRLWPRGVAKTRAHVDCWARELAPSTELRKWYVHDPEKWSEFRRRYSAELSTAGAKAALADLVRRARRGRVTLVYSSHAGDISNAAALARIINRRLKRA